MALRIGFYYPRALDGDGGMTRAVRRLCQAVSDAGGDATLISDQGTNAQAKDTARLVAIAHRHVAGQFIPIAGDLDRVLRSVDLLVLNSAWTAHNVIAGQHARKLGIPYVVAPRGAYDPAIRRRHHLRKSLWWLAFEGPLVGHALALHLSFDSERASVEDAVAYRKEVLVVPNGVETPPDVQWDGGSGGYVLWLGRFDPDHKGLDMLLQAIASLPASQRYAVRLCGPPWRRGKERTAALVRELAIEPWVTVGDAVYGRAKWELLSRAMGFVYPSRWECFGNAVAEAAAIGLPCLVTPYPTGEFLAARGGAVLAPPTPAGLAEGLRTLVGPEATRIGNRAREVVREHFNWDDVGRLFLAQSQRLLAS
jgi:glycosyltransferase involved in cell wall biosynthesis